MEKPHRPEKKRLFGLIGRPLGHSFSERYFAEKFAREGISDAEYRNFELPSIEALPELLAEHPDLQGFNVTIPYKEEVLPYLAGTDAEAAAIGAVNCVKITGSKLTGYNTDAYGFRQALLGLIGGARPAALVLGTGGSSKAVRHALSQLGIAYTVVSRTPRTGGLTYPDLDQTAIRTHRLIINTTPLGTFPDMDAAPDIPYDFLTAKHYLFDLVYNPPLTRFLALGRDRGAAVQNGYDMLAAQAEQSWKIWTGQ